MFNRPLVPTIHLCQVIDIYQSDAITICIRLLEKLSNGECKRFTVRYSDCIVMKHYFNIPPKKITDSTRDKLAKMGMIFFETREFFSGYDSDTIRVGCFAGCGEESRKTLKDIEGLLSNSCVRLNPNWTLLDEFRRQKSYVRAGYWVCYNEKNLKNPLEPTKSNTVVNRDTSHWNLASIRIQTQEPTERDRPVACWSRETKRYGMDIMETMDQPTQSLIRITMEKHSGDDLDTTNHQHNNVIDLNLDDFDNEMIMIRRFIGEFAILRNQFDVLVCWDYTLGLEYIKNRFICGMENLNYSKDQISVMEHEFMVKVYGYEENQKLNTTSYNSTWSDTEEFHQQCISIDALRFDAPQGFAYLSISSLHHHLLQSKNGFSLRHLGLYYFPDMDRKDYDEHTIMVAIFFKTKLLEWILSSGELFFMLDYRSILGPFWKQLYRYLIQKIPSTRFLFQPKWCRKTLEHSIGGLVLDAIVNTFHKNVVQFDIRSSYPSTIREYNFCYTTLLRNPLITIRRNNWKENVDYIRIVLSKEAPDFIELDDDASSNNEGDTEASESSNLVKSVDSKRLREDSSEKTDIVYYVTEKHYKGVLPERVEDLMKLRDSFDKDGTTLASKLTKLFMNKIYGMLRSETLFYCPVIACSITTMAQHSLKNLYKVATDSIEHHYIVFTDSDSLMDTCDKPEIISGDTDGIMISKSNPILSQSILKYFNELFKYIKIREATHFDLVYTINEKCYFAYRKYSDELVERGTESIRQDRYALTKRVCRTIERMLVECVMDDFDYSYYQGCMQHIKEIMEEVANNRDVPTSKWSLAQEAELIQDRDQEKKFNFLVSDSKVGQVELAKAIQEAKSKAAPLLLLLKNCCSKKK